MSKNPQSKNQKILKFEEAFASLNSAQKEAVNQIEGPVMVLAGPGTGKTQIIALRIARILQETQVDPHNILCLTFTESGVVAMRERLMEMIGPTAYYVKIHTFHSFCNEIIQENAERFVMAKELVQLNDLDRVQLLEQLLDALPAKDPLKPFGSPYFYMRDVSTLIQTLKREDISVEQLREQCKAIESFLQIKGEALEVFTSINGNSLKEEEVVKAREILKGTHLDFFNQAWPQNLEKKERTAFKKELKELLHEMTQNLPKQKSLLELYEAYNRNLQKTGRYDYDDMILFVVRAFKKDPVFLAWNQEKYHYLLVDEYQDTNGAQNEIIELLSSHFEIPNVFTVGDDKQSVYRFQGASLENMMSFLKRNKPSLVALDQNYRSQQNILDASHALILNNEQSLLTLMPHISQELKAAKSIPLQPIQILSTDSPDHENKAVAQRIKNLIQSGISPSEIAVLYRKNADAEELLPCLRREQIPFQVKVGNNILKDPLIKDFINLLKAVNGLEPQDLYKALNLDFLGLNALDLACLTRFCRERDVFLNLSSEEELKKAHVKNPQQFLDLAQKITAWKKSTQQRTLIESVELIMKESGFYDATLKREDALRSLNRLISLFEQAKAWCKTRENMDLKEFLLLLDLLAEHGLSIKEKELSSDEVAVQLMTAHRAKGLEFEHVFILNCVDRHWGNITSQEKIKLPKGLLTYESLQSKKEKNEDERRLFYVAMTRAKHGLTLSFSKNKEDNKPQTPSIFLKELPENLVEEIHDKLHESEEKHLRNYFENTGFAKSIVNLDGEEFFLKSLVKNHVMNVTHLNSYLKCPRAFYFDHLLRVPSAKSKSAAFGTGMHHAMHQLILAQNRGVAMPLEEIFAQFEKALRKEILTEKDHWECVDKGREVLGDYLEKCAHLLKNGKPEYDFRPHNVIWDGIPITGRIDLLEFLDSGQKNVHVVDYKTGQSDNKKSELRPGGNYHRQIVFYQLLCDQSPRFPFKMLSGEIRYLEPSREDGLFKRFPFQVTSEDMSRLQQELRDVHQDIQDLKFLDPDRACGDCDHCLWLSQN